MSGDNHNQAHDTAPWWVRVSCALRGHLDYSVTYAGGLREAMCSRCGRWEVSR